MDSVIEYGHVFAHVIRNLFVKNLEVYTLRRTVWTQIVKALLEYLKILMLFYNKFFGF